MPIDRIKIDECDVTSPLTLDILFVRVCAWEVTLKLTCISFFFGSYF